MKITPFKWTGDRLVVLDQRCLPHRVKYHICQTPAQVARAIKDMAVRGAPAIGCVAAYGLALALSAKAKPRKSRIENRKSIKELNNYIPRSIFDSRFTILEKAAGLLKSARPTAVNLAWAVERMMMTASNHCSSRKSLFSTLLNEAKKIETEDVAANRAMGRLGSRLLKKNSVVLTHCNAGALATAGWGTALGIIRMAQSQGKIKKVLVDETRPYLQGARLTAWELEQEGIPYELITDNMAAHFMKTERVDAVIVGCDRVARNGDTANKIGTYSLAVLARYHRIPFYVAMPTSTFDPSLKSGSEIPIEERSSDEVTKINGRRVAPKGTRARHPAFDVTPNALISAIVTERGIFKAPLAKSLKKLNRRLTSASFRKPAAAGYPESREQEK